MKLSTKEKEELSKDFNISLPTFYSWEKTKPRLIEIIKLGLEYEKIKSENTTNEASHEKTIETIFQKLEELEKKINKN